MMAKKAHVLTEHEANELWQTERKIVAILEKRESGCIPAALEALDDMDEKLRRFK